MSEPRYEYCDPRFYELTLPNTQLERLYDRCRWAEGPVWFNDGGYLLFSDIPNQRILRWTPEQGVSLYRANSNFANGNTRDRQGRLVTCEHGTRRVTRTEPDGSLTVIADQYQGHRLNSPNDVVVHTDGSIWFTDPTYGIMSDYEGNRGAPEQPGRYVYRVDGASGEITCVADDFVQPNGLAFSACGQWLYVADSARSHAPHAPHHIRKLRVLEGGRLGESRVFAEIEPGIPDGLRVDVNGNVWTSAGDGIQCFAADGTLLGKVLLPEKVANLTFGGPRRNQLFMTANTSVYLIHVAVAGVQWP
ncbi:SMP-30/gluconolactonase/LRE family protein [Pseudomonas sp. C2L12B]|uniref:SMP-30/gluconolactonase/LRE family protein n=2 Tax=Pseudomonas typographi TaxID=2715964 RepID=A0ABR7Z108_9PSED|nr:SMP-30/gluconolactonase/LRE family protein [Pseudomonas typographi]MBD1554805.1 SMP-30/gluconolactonase/LRE family protein [Pseudomonas typographi]MBD1587328.1 SMP-30/gluconolactonase/LRE family protein [Pseudomonas typographi]MBD1599176.1 SMP-30/gluconolactonase/LRE family protein [Pseudomonas typographi]